MRKAFRGKSRSPSVNWQRAGLTPIGTSSCLKRRGHLGSCPPTRDMMLHRMDFAANLCFRVGRTSFDSQPYPEDGDDLTIGWYQLALGTLSSRGTLQLLSAPLSFQFTIPSGQSVNINMEAVFSTAGLGLATTLGEQSFPNAIQLSMQSNGAMQSDNAAHFNSLIILKTIPFRQPKPIN